MTPLDRRLKALEARPPPVAVLSPEESHRRLVEEAAACGLSVADVDEKLGGWGEFIYARRIACTVQRLVPDPEEEAARARREARRAERLARHGGDLQAALLEALREPWTPREPR